MGRHVFLNRSHKSSRIGKCEDDPAPLDAANEEDGECQVAEERVRLAVLVHPQSIVQVEGPLLLLDQLVLGWDVLAERVFAKVAAKVLTSCSCCCGKRSCGNQAALPSKKRHFSLVEVNQAIKA